MKTCWRILTFVILIIGVSWYAMAADWPQYRGPNQDGLSKETGLAFTWPADGPNVSWRVPIGDGYSGMIVSQGRLYTMYSRDKQEFVACFDTASGKEIWNYKNDVEFENDQGNGPRGTPTLDGETLYALGARGVLVALNAKDGSVLWNKDLKSLVQLKVPIWGVSSSPLIEGNLLIVPGGGAVHNAIVALDKKTGKVMWKSQTDEPGYSTAIPVEIQGVRQIIVFSGTVLFSVSPSDGKLYWKYPWKTDWFVNAAVPIFVPPDKIFISTSYDRGAALLQVTGNAEKLNVQDVWLSKAMKNHFNTSVMYKGHIYGFDNAILKCIEAATGKEKWMKSGFQKGSLILADGHLIVLSERGVLATIEATPEEYIEKAKAQVLKGKCWTMPTLANGKLYVRNQKELVSIDMKPKTAKDESRQEETGAR